MNAKTPHRRTRRLQSLLRAACLAAALHTVSTHAVTILDSTWREEGGRKGREKAGFGAHIALAAQPQFRAVLAMSTDEEDWDEASATWIGNQDGHAFILTAAHIFDLPAQADEFSVRTPDGTVHHPDRVWIHPQWNGNMDARSGFDLAILRLPTPLTGLGPAPLLYGGGSEEGKLITFVGFGNRGIGSTGESELFNSGAEKAAAQGVIDECAGEEHGVAADADHGNYLAIFMAREDGGIPNDLGGKNTPPTRLAGLLGKGDSGGSAWIKLGDRWIIVGVNSNGTGKSGYGDTAEFTRVATQRTWISRIFPGARFVKE